MMYFCHEDSLLSLQTMVFDSDLHCLPKNQLTSIQNEKKCSLCH